jgi:hypothetical protein
MGREWLTGQNTLQKTPKEKLTKNQMTKGLFIGSWKKACVQTQGVRSNVPVIHGRTYNTRSTAENRQGQLREARADWTAFVLSIACDSICVRTQIMRSNALQDSSSSFHVHFCSLGQGVM